MQAIRCDSLSITYDVHGIATINMQVFSDRDILDVSALPKTFGGVHFTIIGINMVMKQVDNSGVYQYNVTLTGIGE